MRIGYCTAIGRSSGVSRSFLVKWSLHWPIYYCKLWLSGNSVLIAVSICFSSSYKTLHCQWRSVLGHRLSGIRKRKQKKTKHKSHTTNTTGTTPTNSGTSNNKNQAKKESAVRVPLTKEQTTTSPTSSSRHDAVLNQTGALIITNNIAQTTNSGKKSAPANSVIHHHCNPYYQQSHHYPYLNNFIITISIPEPSSQQTTSSATSESASALSCEFGRCYYVASRHAESSIEAHAMSHYLHGLHYMGK